MEVDHPTNTWYKYNLTTVIWTEISTTNTPFQRAFQTTVWTGEKMIIYGGYYGSNWIAKGYFYDLTTDSWTALTSLNTPVNISHLRAVWTGDRMIVRSSHQSKFWCPDCGDSSQDLRIYLYLKD